MGYAKGREDAQGWVNGKVKDEHGGVPNHPCSPSSLAKSGRGQTLIIGKLAFLKVKIEITKTATFNFFF